MISNQDNYLFLKQVLAIIESQRKGMVVNFNNQPLDPESAKQMALNKLIDVEDQYTIPRFVDNVTETTIDFQTAIEAITFWVGDLRDTNLSDNEAMQLILEVDKPDNLYRSIVEYPLLTCYDDHKVNLNAGTLFPVDKQTVIDAANAVDDALILINKWVTEDLSHFSVAQLIILLNCVQMLDEMFQFGNDRFIGC